MSIDNGKETLGKFTKYQKHNDEEIKKLSEINKKLRIEIENCKKIDKKLEKKAKKKIYQKRDKDKDERTCRK